MRSALIDFAADLYRWWRWEIGNLLGVRAADSGSAAVLGLGRDGIRIERTAGSGTGTLIRLDEDVGAAVRALLPGSRRGRAAVDLLIEPDRYLMRPLSPLRLPRSRMRTMARLDYAAATPFKPGECFLIIPDYREAQPRSSYYIVRRAHLEPVLESLRLARIDVRRVALAEADGAALPDADSLAGILPPSLPRRLARKAVRWGTAAAAVGLVAVIGAAHWRYAAALEAIDAEIAVAERDAASARAAIDARYRQIARIAAARGAKSQAVPLVRTLEELARTLPDTTWLTGLDFSETTVTFTGISPSAAALIPALEASPLFRAPTFTEPVLREAGGGERFTIAIQTEAAGG